MRSWIAALAGVMLIVGVYGCGGTGPAAAQQSSSPAGPTAPVASVVTIDIAEINGPYSFYPSPATVTANQTVVWRNSDLVTHHVAFDDDSIDTGTIAPGTLSQPKTIAAGTRTYHCTIHPTMAGTVVVVSSSTLHAHPKAR
jgi:plastocyanin